MIFNAPLFLLWFQQTSWLKNQKVKNMLQAIEEYIERVGMQNFERDKQLAYDDMKENYKEVVQILRKFETQFGDLNFDKDYAGFYMGLGFILRSTLLPTEKQYTYLIIYADKRFSIQVLKGDAEVMDFYHRKDERYQICEFTDWVTLKNVEEKLGSFKQIL